ncbi:MAG TPA: NAD(P)/FAD-dependent oxidoreductase [Acidobacteriaceae bacterium]|jgi:protoporphyrinogen oxidase|nr:NAD(P)/FAD-dependent oxidoreductase [Acidobacteriaceae bacterium]
MKKTVIVIGAGPAGLTASLELLRRSDIHPIVLEASDEIGGISRTIRYKGNRMDIGGHRFFSKSDKVMEWWLELMPAALAEGDGATVPISYQNKQRAIAPGNNGAANMDDDLVMLVRPRKSRIYFLRQFFDYPIKLTGDTLRGLGVVRTCKVGISYFAAKIVPRKPEKSLEDFVVNRFGKQLYQLFFESYTEKVWGVHPRKISAEWGAQRIKGLSLTSAVRHFAKQAFSKKKKETGDFSQKGTETSLIERFLYPKFGPGQLWEHVASQVIERGGEIHMQTRVTQLKTDGSKIVEVGATDANGQMHWFKADYVISTMPIRHLIRSLQCDVPEEVIQVSNGLIYRDFITVGLLVNRLLVTEPDGTPLKDTWIYIQEPDVKVGRLQIFNNWSPWMVADPSKMWIGMEYFCNDTDDLWKMPDDAIREFAVTEMEKIGMLQKSDVLDGHVVRVPKTYPAYFGTYDQFPVIQKFTDQFENLFLVGRNGMHKYNNQDHSMLTAMSAVDNILDGTRSKENIWDINTEQEYHEEKRS